MGYFANGTEATRHEDEYCEKCAHYNDGECPVMDAHFIYSYDLCNQKDHPGKIILDMLIPTGPGGPHCDKCKMYIKKEVIDD